MKKISQKIVMFCLCSVLVGCGLAQTVKDGTVNMKDAILYKKITTLHLDFVARSGLNTDEDQTPLATMVWVYQLKDKKVIENSTYQMLLTRSDEILKKDMLNATSVMVMPDGQVSLDEPLEKETQFIAVLGMFRDPNLSEDTWRLVINREDLDADKPRVIELGDGWLRLLPLKD
ncbi:type VI secretion system protein VasD [Proteus mirabilis]|nr:type VI secretion system protein VasD [Proteus mirabilis]